MKPAAAPSIADDPFGDNDEGDIARIAREMEAKYVSLNIMHRNTDRN